MAESFKNRVDALTGFGSTDDSPLNDWLTDGAREIVNILPDDLLQYCVDYTAMASSTAMNIGTDTDIGKVMFVTRNNGTRYLPCRLIPSSYFGFADDPSNLTYHGTTTDPVYSVISDGTNPGVKVFPNPTSSFNARVHHVAFPDVGGGDTDIDNFPDNAEYLVVLYAAQKALQRLMNNKNSSLSALSVTAVPPDIPTLSTTTVSFSQAVPSYSPPTVGGATESLTATMTAVASDQIGTDADFLDFSDWFAALGEMIEDDEDIELASAQIEKINSYIQSYNVAMQNELNNFNESVAPYQAQLQISIQNAQLADAADSKKLSKFQAEVAEYQAEVNLQVQEYAQNLQKDTLDYGWYAQQYAALKADYMTGIQMLVSGGLPQPQQQARR